MITTNQQGFGTPGRRNPAPDGFSLIEVLISGAILLIVVTGLLPLFTRAMTDNIQGRRSTEVANEARSEVERLMQLGFNHAELTLVSGSELKSTDYWDPTTKAWRDSGSYTPTGAPEFERETIIRQYGDGALTDELLDPAEALDSTALSAEVVFKEIEVTVTASPHLRTPEKTVTVRTLRSL